MGLLCLPNPQSYIKELYLHDIALAVAAGNIIGRFENKGFQLRALKLYQTPKEVAEEHYKDLAEKPFYPDLVNYIISGPVVCMVRVALAWTLARAHTCWLKLSTRRPPTVCLFSSMSVGVLPSVSLSIGCHQ